MKVIQVTTSSKGGAGIAALRLHQALHKAGIQSAYISLDRTIDYANLEVKDSFFAYRKPSLGQRIFRKLSKKNGNKTQVYQRHLESWGDELDYEIISFPFSKFNLEDHPLVQEADIIHLHWVGDFLDFESFFAVNTKPIAWTFHDMNPFKGIFHYQGDEDRNLQVRDMDREILKLKRKAIQRITSGAVISPSQWLLECANQSGYFNHFEQKVCIPNGMPLEVFKTAQGTDLRKNLGIMEDEKVLLYTSGTLDNHRKGVDLILNALEILTVPVTLLTLGKGSMETSNKAVKIIPLGFLSEASEIAACYDAADAFVLPSREDN
ncbi:MAG: glycosyltransferase, partial [Bacteroidota bacterium]